VKNLHLTCKNDAVAIPKELPLSRHLGEFEETTEKYVSWLKGNQQ